LSTKRINTTNAPTINLYKTYSTRSRSNGKPEGLWYGIDWQWHEWCEAEDFAGVGKNNFELNIDMSEVLILSKLDDLNRLPTNRLFPGSRIDEVNWPELKKKYKGFELVNQSEIENESFDPFLSEDRSCLWPFVNGLDCDCGCIWDLSAIKKTAPAMSQNLDLLSIRRKQFHHY